MDSYAVSVPADLICPSGLVLSSNQTESDGRMFPQSNSSASIIDCLLQEAKRINGMGISVVWYLNTVF